jgi:hypothetical protein
MTRTGVTDRDATTASLTMTRTEATHKTCGADPEGDRWARRLQKNSVPGRTLSDLPLTMAGSRMQVAVLSTPVWTSGYDK